jgi:hypothetical protein
MRIGFVRSTVSWKSKSCRLQCEEKLQLLSKWTTITSRSMGYLMVSRRLELGMPDTGT